jgi:hypothetical protein
MVAIFSVQDETGTVTQLTLQPSPAIVVSIGDTGLYEGFPDNGEITPSFQSLHFTVVQVVDGAHFSVRANNANMADWPAGGTITWETGANVTDTSTVIEIDGANAYITVTEFTKYHNSRGNAVPAGAVAAAIQQAIVQSTDYLDAKYRYSGVKRLQVIGNSGQDVNAVFLNSWITPFAVVGTGLAPQMTSQSTQWPRQGVVDNNGDTVLGIPKAIKDACAELTIRVLNGVVLQPDYDPSLVGAGGVASSITKKVGPLETIVSYDTRFGLGFFASFPIVDRILKSGGLLNSGGGRSVMR